MLGALARLVQPLPSRTFDYLFTPFAPDGAPAQTLCSLYHQYDHLLPDEAMPPQHRHFRALVDAVTGGDASALERLDGAPLRRVCSAYVTCFERSEPFKFQLSLWRNDPAFRTLLIQAREQVVAELAANADAEDRRRAHYSRWRECLAAPIDLHGALIDQIRWMSPDDWHEIVLRWNWDAGVAELDWITSRRECDRATAVFALCMGEPGAVAGRHSQCAHDGFVRTLASRLENGFYPRAEFGLELTTRTRAAFERELAAARATGVSPWQLPAELITHPGVRRHQPKYAVTNGGAHYHYEYWLAHVAPRR